MSSDRPEPVVLGLWYEDFNEKDERLSPGRTITESRFPTIHAGMYYKNTDLLYLRLRLACLCWWMALPLQRGSMRAIPLC